MEDASRTVSRAGCTHNYFQPAPCRDDVSWWACVGNGDDGTEHLEQELQTWYERTGKPIWVTEFACNPWAERACDASLHARLMDQVVPVLEASPMVFRYAWFAAYEAASMPGNALNRETWNQLSDVSCPNNSWTAGYGDASWQIQTNAECVAAAEADASCATPLVLNIGWDACYCATDACDVPIATSYMTTYRYAGDNQGLAPLGGRYENFTWESPCQPSRAPTLSPTSTPTTPPTVRALSSSSSSSEGKPGTVAVVLMVILGFLFWQGVYDSCLFSNMCEECASNTTAAPREARHTPEAPAATVKKLMEGFPSWFVSGVSYRAPRGDTDWSCDDEAVGKVLVRYVYRKRSGLGREKTYVVCIAVRKGSPFASGTLKKEYRVLYGVPKRYRQGGSPIHEDFDDIYQTAFNEALPEEPLEVATAKALREALDARPAAPRFSGAAATSADLQLAELKAEIEARDGAPRTPHTPRTIQVFSDIDALFEEHGDHHTDESAA